MKTTTTIAIALCMLGCTYEAPVETTDEEPVTVVCPDPIEQVCPDVPVCPSTTMKTEQIVLRTESPLLGAWVTLTAKCPVGWTYVSNTCEANCTNATCDVDQGTDWPNGYNPETGVVGCSGRRYEVTGYPVTSLLVQTIVCEATFEVVADTES